MMELLEVENISKNYKGFSLQNINFSLPAGYIMGYIGQNGAGKTTTLNAINHLIHTDTGKIWIDGITFEQDPVSYRDKIGYIGDSAYFPENMNIGNIRSILKDFYPSFRPEEFDRLVKEWQLPLKGKIKTFSRGMKVKLMFAVVFARDTKLLVLDEATNGLDPIVRKDILKMLQDYIEDGDKSVIFSTHIMEDLEEIADYIFFIDRGRMMVNEAKDELIEKYLLVRGGLEDLSPNLQEAFIGIEKNEFGFEALYSTDSEVLLPKGLLASKPPIDKIVVHMLQEAR